MPVLPWGSMSAARARPWTPPTCSVVMNLTGTQQQWCLDLAAYCANSDPTEGQRRLCRCLTEGRRLCPCLTEEPHSL